MAKACEPTDLCFWGPVSRGLTRWSLDVCWEGGQLHPVFQHVRISMSYWLVVFRPTPLKNDGVRQWVSDDIPCMKWTIKNVWNHQPAYYSLFNKNCFFVASCFQSKVSFYDWVMAFYKRKSLIFFLSASDSQTVQKPPMCLLCMLCNHASFSKRTHGYESKLKAWGTTNFSRFSALTIELLRYPKLTHTIPYPHLQQTLECWTLRTCETR